MKKCFSAILTLFLVLSINGYSTETKENKYSYYLSIGAIFNDEADYLKEWIEYHRLAGPVEHFYLYNNNSQDHYLDVLQPLY